VKTPDVVAPTAISADKSVAQPKPAQATAPTAAHLFELKLRSELADTVLSKKLNIHATANALTLSGSLNIAEHRELMAHLHTVPAGVRVIDDIDLTGDAKSVPAN
jgi:hypothetical protein